jgi:hypothetical protein
VWHAVAEALWSLSEPVVPLVIEQLLDNDPVMRKGALKGLLWLTREYDEDDLRGGEDEEDYYLGTGWSYLN